MSNRLSLYEEVLTFFGRVVFQIESLLGRSMGLRNQRLDATVGTNHVSSRLIGHLVCHLYCFEEK